MVPAQGLFDVDDPGSMGAFQSHCLLPPPGAEPGHIAVDLDKTIVKKVFLRINIAHKEAHMTMVLYNTDAPKKATNLSINTDLLRKAKEKRINLSHTLENRLVEMLAEAQCQEWKKENQEAIETYNRRIQRNGVFSEGLRRF